MIGGHDALAAAHRREWQNWQGPGGWRRETGGGGQEKMRLLEKLLAGVLEGEVMDGGRRHRSMPYT